MPAETAIFIRALRSLTDSIMGMQAAYMSFGQAVRPLFSDIDAYNKQLGATFSQVAVWALTRRAAVTQNETARMSTPFHVVSSIMCLLCMQIGLLLTQAWEERGSGILVRLALSRRAGGLLRWPGSWSGCCGWGCPWRRDHRTEILLPRSALSCFWRPFSACTATGSVPGGVTCRSKAAPAGRVLFILALLLWAGIYPETAAAAVKPLMACRRPIMPTDGTRGFRAAICLQWPRRIRAMAALSALLLGLARRQAFADPQG